MGGTTPKLFFVVAIRVTSSLGLAFSIFCLLSANTSSLSSTDWLLDRSAGTPPVVNESVCWEDGLCGIEITNGLISRRFVLSPAFGTVDFVADYVDTSSMFRAIEPEATLVLALSCHDENNNNIVNSCNYINEDCGPVEFRVGGLESVEKFRAYANRTGIRSSLQAVPSTKDAVTFRYVSHQVATPIASFPWTPGTRHGLLDISWPPAGVTLQVRFALRDRQSAFSDLQVTMHYEIYNGIPLMAKWMSIDSSSASFTTNNKASPAAANTAIICSATVERLASSPPFGAYISHGSSSPYASFDGSTSQSGPPPLLHAMTDQAHGATCRWEDDSHDPSPLTPDDVKDASTGAVQPLLNCSYTSGGPGARLRRIHLENQNDLEGPASDATADVLFESFRVFLLATDSPELVRQTLSRHRMTQLLAPHTTENPLFFHATATDDDADFARAIDQMAELGFEMLIYSFGSGFVMETTNKTYLAKIKRQVDYAKSRGIEVGGYDLICLDRGYGAYGDYVGDEWTTVSPSGALLHDACLASGWYDKLVELVYNFLNATGITMLETDGPYGGGGCSSTNHSHHHDAQDAVYHQTQLQNAFFKEMRRLGVYVNQPDGYFFQGGNRGAMGYHEEQYSLPRWRDLTISRMGLFDDLYRYLPTQGWMFVPLVEYHGGGQEAEFLGHKLEYEWALAQNLGAGIAACYRGPYLYNESTAEGLIMKSTIKKWVDFYKAHRDNLIQPVVHLRRPSMQTWDGWMHVNPFGITEVALAIIFNPTDRMLKETDIVLPLYYTSLTDEASITVDETVTFVASLARDYSVTVSLDMEPKSIHTVVLKRCVRGKDAVEAQ